MVKLLVCKIENNNYTLLDEEGTQYQFVLNFFDLQKKPNIGTVILMHQELLNPEYEEYNTTYSFGPLDQPYGRSVTPESVDFIAIKTDNVITNLKRFFGWWKTMIF